MFELNQKNIYEKFGQYENVVIITLKQNSLEFDKYGKPLVGAIRYKKDERELLQTSLESSEVDLSSLINIKIDDNISKIDTTSKYDLFYEGIPLESIDEIHSIPYNLTNNYIKKDLRTLPEPILIKINSTNFDAPVMYIGLYESLHKDGFVLTEFEKKQLIAYKIILNGYNSPEEINDSEYDEEVRYYVLEYKYLYSELTSEETIEFEQILEKRIKESVDILMKNLSKESEGSLSFLSGRIDLISLLSKIATFFKPERLTFSKIPVWWNLERYLHIVLGHVSEFQFCVKTQGNTSFQYHLKDVKNVISSILKSLTEEINDHFEKYPGKDFKRQGGMSYYYEGDYYVIHIRHDGLLLTLYKNN